LLHEARHELRESMVMRRCGCIVHCHSLDIAVNSLIGLSIESTCLMVQIKQKLVLVVQLIHDVLILLSCHLSLVFEYRLRQVVTLLLEDFDYIFWLLILSPLDQVLTATERSVAHPNDVSHKCVHHLVLLGLHEVFLRMCTTRNGSQAPIQTATDGSD
jgi:hypothetical protein